MSIKNIFNRFGKKAKIAVGAGVALLAIGVPAAVMAGYGPNGPDRVIYDFSNPAQREGAFDGPRFNSYINTNVYGDERAFLDAKECVASGDACYQQGVAGGFKDQQPVSAGKEYIVRAYVHNIANPSINDNPATPAPMDGIGVAKNTRIRFELPAEGFANGFTGQARISADNAIPQMVYDTVDFKNPDQKVSVSYVPGSARIYNAAHPNGFVLGDSIMGAEGVQIGHETMGVYPGCFEFSSFVVIRVVVKAPDLEVKKTVSKVDMPKLTDVSENVTIKRGETVSWRIDYKNNGSAVVGDVTIRDQLPAGATIVPGSIKLTTAAGTETLPDTALGSGGVNVGDYLPNGNGVIRFRTVVNPNEDVCELVNVAFGRAKDVSERSDDAKVTISDCKSDKPIVRCEALKVEKLGGRKVKVTVSTLANPSDRAKLKMIDYNFGDGATLKTDKTSVEHDYAKDGTYAISAKVTFEVDGKLVEGSGNCVANVTFGPAPTTLPDTGAGGVIGIVAATTAAGYALAVRRFARG